VRRAVLAALPRLEPTDRSTHIMKGRDSKTTQEPVGIIISGMPRTQQPTVFSAYVWGPAPVTADEDPKAA